MAPYLADPSTSAIMGRLAGRRMIDKAEQQGAVKGGK